MDDHLACYGCGSIFDSSEADWQEDDGDLAARCGECGSSDVVTYSTYLEQMG